MGWTYHSLIATRSAMVEHLRTQLVGRYTVVRASTVGNHWWAVIANRESGKRSIFLALMAGGRRDGWGYKDMDESAGPCYYDCPLGFFDLAPPPESEHAAGWRDKVRAYHTAKRERPTPQPGLIVEYGGHRYTLDRPCGPRKGWHVTRADGVLFRMKANQLANAKLVEGFTS